jgi:hypothetical protein
MPASRIGSTWWQKIRVRIPLSAIAAVLVGVAVGFVLGNILGVRKAIDIKEWQTTIGVVVAVAAATVAWINVQTTLRVNLISREEDRMERTLPGLTEAAKLLTSLVGDLRALQHKEFSITTIYGALPGFGDEAATLPEAVEKQTPNTDGPTRHRVTEGLKTLITKSAELQAAWSEFERASSDSRDIAQFAEEAKEGVRRAVQEARRLIDERLRGFEEALSSLERLQGELQGRIETFERRLPVFRKRIEAFFRD